VREVELVGGFGGGDLSSLHRSSSNVVQNESDQERGWGASFIDVHRGLLDAHWGLSGGKLRVGWMLRGCSR
jgi:hypothetical protein